MSVVKSPRVCFAISTQRGCVTVCVYVCSFTHFCTSVNTTGDGAHCECTSNSACATYFPPIWLCWKFCQVSPRRSKQVVSAALLTASFLLFVSLFPHHYLSVSLFPSSNLICANLLSVILIEAVTSLHIVRFTLNFCLILDHVCDFHQSPCVFIMCYMYFVEWCTTVANMIAEWATAQFGDEEHNMFDHLLLLLHLTNEDLATFLNMSLKVNNLSEGK